MSRVNNISIKNKLILMQVFTSVLVLSIFFAVFIFTYIKSYKQKKAKSVFAMAHVLGVNSISSLRFQDNENAKKTLLELKDITPEVTYAIINDKNGKTFASYNEANNHLPGIPLNLMSSSYAYTEDKLFVAENITADKEKLGTIILAVNLSELAQIKQSVYEIGLILLIIAIGFSFLIAIIVQKYISARLLFLVNTVEEVSKTGDYNKTISADGNDEIAILIRVFNNMLEQVKESQRRKDEFIGIASHELKTPLTSLKGYIELLLRIDDENLRRQFVQKSMVNINKLEKLIRELLDVSRIESGQLLLNMQPFDIDALIDETVTEMQVISKTHQLIRENKFKGLIITADRQRIEQVIINLLSNAVKYSPGEKQVVIESIVNETSVIIKIRDFGVGIPPEEQSNVFERFYRAKENSIHISGFGLGLYICRDIIRRHNGEIWMESEQKGSSFYFSLPFDNKIVYE